jgi:hypothetical protein
MSYEMHSNNKHFRKSYIFLKSDRIVELPVPFVFSRFRQEKESVDFLG